ALDQRIKRTNSARLKGILPVHLYGQCAEMNRIDNIASEYKLKVIEDAAQAFGATWRGKHAGGLGRAAAFSFYPTKNLSCYGDGDLGPTTAAEVAFRLGGPGTQGSPQPYYQDEMGWNRRLDSIQAAILRVKLKHLSAWNTARNQRATAYDVLFKSSGLLATGA